MLLSGVSLGQESFEFWVSFSLRRMNTSVYLVQVADTTNINKYKSQPFSNVSALCDFSQCPQLVQLHLFYAEHVTKTACILCYSRLLVLTILMENGNKLPYKNQEQVMIVHFKPCMNVFIVLPLASTLGTLV